MRAPQVNALVLIGDVVGVAFVGDGDALDVRAGRELADELGFEINIQSKAALRQYGKIIP
jgi:hypothetical protein